MGEIGDYPKGLVINQGWAQNRLSAGRCYYSSVSLAPEPSLQITHRASIQIQGRAPELAVSVFGCLCRSHGQKASESGLRDRPDCSL